MEGIGKRTTASVFAHALNCGAEDPPCDACPSCRKAEHHNHPDIVTMAAEGQFIKIGAVRELQRQMTFRPSEGRRRVFLIPEADRLNAAAANALLKTLEEPSKGNILLLTTARPQALPMTILSRCQHLRFAPLTREEVERYLREKVSLTPDEATVLACSSGGSIGKALEMTREDYLAMRGEILNSLSSRDPADPLSRLTLAGRFGTEREEILEKLQVLRTCYRDCLVLSETRESERVIFRDRLGVIQSIAGHLTRNDLLSNIAAIEGAVNAIERNANKALTLEAMAIRIK
jgi:DNA polymerase-3 subunit delta'